MAASPITPLPLNIPVSSPRRSLRPVPGEVQVCVPGVGCAPLSGARTPQAPLSRPPTPRPLRGAPHACSRPPEVAEGVNVEQELSRSNYKPYDKVFFQNSEGQTEAKYIKAINELGQRVFVELDTDGYVSIQEGGLPMQVSREAKFLPASLKQGVMQCSGTNIAGVAFECTEGICTMTRNVDTMESNEENFTYASGPSGRQASPITYPIIRLSEIKANPRLILRNTDEALRRLRNTTFRHAQEEFTKTQKLSQDITGAIDQFYQKILASTQSLAKSIDELEGYNQVYLEHAPVEPEQKRNAQAIMDNLLVRHDKMADLIRVLEAVSEQRAQMQAHLEILTAYTDYVEKNFTQLDRDLQ
jgi:hypothetical protein